MVRPNDLMTVPTGTSTPRNIRSIVSGCRLFAVDRHLPAGIHQLGQNEPASAGRVGVDRDARGRKLGDLRSRLPGRLFPGDAAAASPEFVEIKRLAVAGPGRIEQRIEPLPHGPHGPFGLVERIETQHVRHPRAAEPFDPCREGILRHDELWIDVFDRSKREVDRRRRGQGRRQVGSRSETRGEGCGRAAEKLPHRAIGQVVDGRIGHHVAVGHDAAHEPQIDHGRHQDASHQRPAPHAGGRRQLRIAVQELRDDRQDQGDQTQQEQPGHHPF